MSTGHVSEPAAINMLNRQRRVVTGLGPDGRSCVLFDDVVACHEVGPGIGTALVWRTDRIPACDSGSEDVAARPFDMAMMRDGGSNFMLFEFAPDDRMVGPGLHATDTIDYIVIIKGQVILTTETGEVTLGPGNLVVDRGVLHGWRAIGDENALIAVINLPSDPVGAGATL